MSIPLQTPTPKLPDLSTVSTDLPLPSPVKKSTTILSFKNGLSLRNAEHTDAARAAYLANNPKVARAMMDTFPFPYELDNAHWFFAKVKDKNVTNWIPVSRTATILPKATTMENVKTMKREEDDDDDDDNDDDSGGNDDMTIIPDYAICLNDQFIGSIGFKWAGAMHVTRHTLEIGYWIGEPYWRKGIASCVVAAFTDWGFRKLSWCVRIEALVFAWNEGPSGGVLKKAGFREEARRVMAISKHGEYMDEIRFRILRTEWEHEIKGSCEEMRKNGELNDH